MTNPQRKPLQAVPPPMPKQSNQAVDELIALRREMSEFRKDFAEFSKELSRKVAFGIIGSLVLLWIIGLFLGLLLPSLMR
ncbi:hypothetical protein [Nostoc sp.]|uniref:hypothetical protein n=1 Tax=Nostoc sp. TaxID=1180 RepID=UPI002FF3E386